MFKTYARKAIFVSLSAAAAFLNVAVAAPAQAADYDGRSIAVRYADLDLTTTVGAARLERRIAYAAKIVCGPADMRALDQAMQVRACRTGAIASAEPQVKLILALADRGTRFADAGALTIAAN